MPATQKLDALKQYFGYDSFREGQEELVDTILSGRDCLGVMPTGAGKSICYQLPALMMGGITLVVSPLISLMKDQVGVLTQAGVPAAYLNSSLTERQCRLALDNARMGRYKIIYIAPERLPAGSFRDFARNAEISMVTVDEAHCISQWGQDFRPSYLGVRDFVEFLPRRPVVSAFTATATAAVREDVAAQLRLANPHVLVTGFNRANLFFDVLHPKDKKAALLNFLGGRRDESGIVYCSTRKAAEEVCGLLKLNEYSAACYHAGLSSEERHGSQDDFSYDSVKIIVATNAFGMGIDKSNTRFVVHYNMPKDMESYYQEAGRAGRDGEAANCLLLYSAQDVRTALYLIDNGKDAVYESEESERLIKDRDRKRLREMTYYCRTQDCLRGYILKYFGEKPRPVCKNCGNCLGGAELTDVTVTARKILSCVARMRERYGIKLVLDVLRGAKGERISRLGLDRLSTYNICEEPEKRLRAVVDSLILKGYLRVTDGEYPLLALGENADNLLRGGEQVQIKLIGEKESASRGERQTPQAAGPVDKRLFAKVAALRRELAKKASVPSYAVFPDSALVDMCIKLPSSGEEFLRVSGVGPVKLERYGEAFMRVIAEHQASPDEPPDEPAHTEPSVSEEQVSISVIAGRINAERMQNGLARTTGAKLNLWLIEKGYLHLEDGFKVATEKGEALGIKTVERELQGRTSRFCLFGEQAQRVIMEEGFDKSVNLTDNSPKDGR